MRHLFRAPLCVAPRNGSHLLGSCKLPPNRATSLLDDEPYVRETPSRHCCGVARVGHIDVCRTDARKVLVGSSHAAAMPENTRNGGVDQFLRRVIGAVVLSIFLLKRQGVRAEKKFGDQVAEVVRDELGSDQRIAYVREPSHADKRMPLQREVLRGQIQAHHAANPRPDRAPATTRRLNLGTFAESAVQ
jgi:hypothetical protein